jgi:hypothetical protein
MVEKLPSSLPRDRSRGIIFSPYGMAFPVFCVSCGAPFGYVTEGVIQEDGYVGWLCNDCWPKYGAELGVRFREDDEVQYQMALERAKKEVKGR